MSGLLAAGRGVLIVGVEDQPDGTTRVYVSHRSRGLYFDGPSEYVEAARRAWRSTTRHVVADVDDIPALKCDIARVAAPVPPGAPE